MREDGSDKHWILLERAMLYTGVSYGYCQPQALISTAIFFLSDFILLIKESLFSITLNQDLFIVQETIKTLMGHEWPRLPLRPYLFTTACSVLNSFQNPPKPNAFSLLGLWHRPCLFLAMPTLACPQGLSLSDLFFPF